MFPNTGRRKRRQSEINQVVAPIPSPTFAKSTLLGDTGGDLGLPGAENETRARRFMTRINLSFWGRARMSSSQNPRGRPALHVRCNNPIAPHRRLAQNPQVSCACPFLRGRTDVRCDADTAVLHHSKQVRKNFRVCAHSQHRHVEG